MAMVATFVGNWEQFDRTMENAKKNIVAFEVPVKGLQRELQRMASSFDGTRMVREMSTAAAAIEKVGGVAKLTEAEQRRWNATAQETIEKYKAMGSAVPAEIRKVADELQKAVKASDDLAERNKKSGESLNSLSGIAGKIGPAIAGAFSVGAVVSFGKEMIASAGHVSDLADRFAISTDAVQEFEHVANNTGATVDDMGSAIGKAQKAISENSKETAKTFKELGLSAASLRQLAPEDAFTAIAEAIKDVPHPMDQTRIAMDLFGESGAKMLPAIRAGMSDLREEAHKLGVVLDTEAVKALDDFGDKWENTMRSLKVTTATTALDIIAAFESIPRAVRDLPKIKLSDLFEALTPTSFNDMILKTLRVGALPVTGPLELLNLGRGERDKQAQESAQESLEDLFKETSKRGFGSAPGTRPADELSAEAKAIKALADSLSGADIAADLKKLEAAWKSLTPTQKANEESIKRLVTAYADLRQKAKLDGLPNTLEAVHSAHLPVIRATRDWSDITGKLSTGPLVDLSRQTERVKNMLLGLRADGLIPVTKSFADLSATNMLPWPVDGIKNAGLQITATKEKTVDLNSSIRGLAGAWADLAQVRPLEGWIQDVAELIQLMNIGQQIGADFRKTFTKTETDTFGNTSTKFDFGALKGSEGTGNAIAAYANLAQTAVAGYGALDQATDVKGRGNRVAKGAMTGMAIGGSIVPGWGHLVGAGVGALVGALRNPGFEQEMQRIAKNFGVDISEELARSIDKLKSDFGGDRVAAEIFSLDKIIAEGGGVKDSNAPMMEQRLRDTFSMIETGKFTLDEGREVLDKNFAVFAQHVRESEGLASKTFQEIIALNRTFATNSKMITQFVNEQTGVLGVSVANLAAPLVDKNEDFKRRIADAQKAMSGAGNATDQEKAATNLNTLLDQQRQFAAGSADELERLGVIALGSFNAAVNAGSDWLTAVEGMGPALDTLLGLQRDLGIETQNAGLAELTTFRDRVNANQALVLGTQALGETMKALSSIGGLNTETLAAMEAQGVQTFDRLREAGFSEQQSLKMMKPHLLAVIEAHEQLGTPIDENTAKLIEMAQKSGLLKDDGKDMTKVLKEGFADMKLGTDKLVGSIGLMVKALGENVPDAVQDAIDALAKIPRDIDINARVTYNDPGAPGGPSTGDGSGSESGRAGWDGISMREGGVGDFGSGTLAMLHGREAIIPLDRPSRGGVGGHQEINVYLSEEVIARASARGMPSVLDVYGANR